MKANLINTESDLKGLFYIVKGQYKKAMPCVIGDDHQEHFIGGYDPEDENTSEWYRVLDNVVFHCVYCGSDYVKALKAIERCIKTYRTKKNYFKDVCKYTSEDYYEVHYLGRAPLTPQQRADKQEGRCPRVSPAQKTLERCVFEEYGNYFRDDIEEVEDKVLNTIKESKPLNTTKKRMGKLVKSKPLVQKVEEKVSEPPKKVLSTIKKVKKPHIIGMKSH